eukprot:GILJ01021184.1.p1 GENE.GILJ01021184.1~~GILJ01021184.1.p1  ORF type:complete len:438 (-),score=39.58 GILJ01021184.1:132-1367(-)
MVSTPQTTTYRTTLTIGHVTNFSHFRTADLQPQVIAYYAPVANPELTRAERAQRLVHGYDGAPAWRKKEIEDEVAQSGDDLYAPVIYVDRLWDRVVDITDTASSVPFTVIIHPLTQQELVMYTYIADAFDKPPNPDTVKKGGDPNLVRFVYDMIDALANGLTDIAEPYDERGVWTELIKELLSPALPSVLKSYIMPSITESNAYLACVGIFTFGASSAAQALAVANYLFYLAYATNFNGVSLWANIAVALVIFSYFYAYPYLQESELGAAVINFVLVGTWVIARGVRMNGFVPEFDYDDKTRSADRVGAKIMLSVIVCWFAITIKDHGLDISDFLMEVLVAATIPQLYVNYTLKSIAGTRFMVYQSICCFLRTIYSSCFYTLPSSKYAFCCYSLATFMVLIYQRTMYKKRN